MTGGETLEKFDEITRNANVLQSETLRTIIQHNATTHYLSSFLPVREGSAIDDASFRRFVPISSYDDYIDHINHMAQGDSSPLISVDPLVCFFYSSGTSSSEPKLIPCFNSEHSRASASLANQASYEVTKRLFPPRPAINKSLWFLYAGDVTVTTGGVKKMAASAFPFQNNSPSKSQLLSMCISPLEVLMGSNVEEQMYCHLLCGLRKSESIDNIRSPYAVGLIKAIRLLESKWKQMCEDIKNGSVSSEIKDSGMKDSITEFLDGPHPEISKRIENLLQGNEWNGILGKLWPNLRYVSCVLTGSMEQYYPLLKFYANDIALIGGDYFASECCIAINMDKTQPPEKTSYVMLPTAAYFEFLPFCFGDGIVSNETKNFSSVEVGKMYELVATTYRGLYRYRLGDIIKVVGFYNSSPQVEYVTRAPKLLSEILTERELMSAMQSTQLMLNNDTINEISEFTSFLDAHSIPKRLVIFLEVRDGSMFLLKEKLHWSIDLLNRYSLTFESFLGAVYKEKREMGYMGPLHSCIVKPGSFDILQRFAIESGSPANQYKSPLILRRQKMIELMKESVVLSVMAN